MQVLAVVPVLLVSWSSRNCVGVVVGVLWHFGGVFRSVLTVFRHGLTVFRNVFWVFRSCFGGVSVVSRHCSGSGLGVLKEWYFFDLAG